MQYNTLHQRYRFIDVYKLCETLVANLTLLFTRIVERRCRTDDGCIVLCCIVLYSIISIWDYNNFLYGYILIPFYLIFIAICCILLYCIVLHCIALYWFVFYCIVWYCLALSCNVLYPIRILICFVLFYSNSTRFDYIVSPCSVLYCIV